MEYFLKRASLGSQVLVPIDEERYDRLVNARRTLIDAGTFEQHYELLLGNFKAYEMFCASVSLQSSVEFAFGYERWAYVLSEANRHAVNFLTTTKMYADQVGRNFKHVPLIEPFAVVAKHALSEAYDNSLAYRFVCQLRNHVQHRAFPVHGSRSSSTKVSWFDRTALHCHKSRIQEDKGKFKEHVLDELPQEIDVLEMFRGYMVGLSKVQCDLRKIIQDAVDTARADVAQAKEDFASVQRKEDGPNPSVGLTATKRDGQTWSGAVTLLLDWDDARVSMAEKNRFEITLPNKSA